MTQYAVTDPRTGERISDVPTDTDEQVLAAVARRPGRVHQLGSHELGRGPGEAGTPRRRAAHRAPRGARERDEPRDGQAEDDALGEVDFSADIYGYYADHAEEFLADEPIELLDGDGTAVVRKRPLGVMLGIMPWNYPAYQVARFAGPNLAAGNTVVLKHAPQCPDSARILQQIFDDAGFPKAPTSTSTPRTSRSRSSSPTHASRASR